MALPIAQIAFGLDFGTTDRYDLFLRRRVKNARERDPGRDGFCSTFPGAFPYRRLQRIAFQKRHEASRFVQQVLGFWSHVQSNKSDVVDEAAGRPETGYVSDFIRLRDNGEDGLELQTAVVTCRKPFPFSLLQPNLQVDLVAAVHIADRVYFTALQKELALYDRVLYEMVADKDPRQTNTDARTRWRPPKRPQGDRDRNVSFVAFTQRLMARLLTLNFQLECMDYRRDNWFHADLDYRTFQNLQLERGENLFTFARELAAISSKAITRSASVPENLDPWRARLLWASKAFPMPLVGLFVIEGVCASPDSPLREYPEMKALLNLDVPTAIKVFLAKQISTDFSDNATALVENSVIIGERNKVAMEELRGALKDGCRRIAIFYGGGHMPDIARRLRKQFGVVPTEVNWRTAWCIKGQRLTKQDFLSAFLNSLAKLSGWPLNRYQTFALLLFSWVLAVDLWFWELCFSALNEYADQVIIAVGQLLDKAWGL